jgi:hypothetical protein
MDTITELKPLFMRFFQEVDALNAKIKEKEEEIKKLRAENEVYARVIRSETIEVHNIVVEGHEGGGSDDEEEQSQQRWHQSSDTKHVEIKRGRKKKYTTDEERKEKRKEYNRNYRQKQKTKDDE